MHNLIPLTSYVLKAAARDKLFFSIIGAILIITSLSLFMSSTAVLEKQQFNLVYLAGSLRFVGVLGLILFVVFFIRRSFESKDIEFLLSRPINRLTLVLSYALAFSVIALLITLAQSVCVFLVGHETLHSGFYLWAGSILAENIVMVNVAFFISMVITSQTLAALCVLGFYVLSRLMGSILGIIYSGKASIIDIPALDYIMQFISALMPRLDLFGQTSWLIYGYPDSGPALGFVLLQLATFTLVVICLTAIDLMRRQF